MALDASPALVNDRVFADLGPQTGDGGSENDGTGRGDGSNSGNAGNGDTPGNNSPASVTWLDLFNEMMGQGGSATSILNGGRKGLGEIPTTSGSPSVDYPYIPAPPAVRDGSVKRQGPSVNPETPAFEGPVVIDGRVPIPMAGAVRLIESRKGDVTRDSLDQMIRYPKTLEPGVLDAAKYIWQNFDTIRDLSEAGSKTGDKLSGHDLSLLADLIAADQKDRSAKKSSLKNTYTDYELSRKDAPYVAGATLTVTGIAMLAARKSGLRGLVSAGTGGIALGKTVSKPIIDELIVGGGVDDYYKSTAGPAINKLFISGQ